MPDQSSAAREHALMQEIQEPLASLPPDSVPDPADFPTVLRGYDKIAVDAYVRKMSQLLSELQARRSPDAAVRRAYKQAGDDVAGILERAHETARDVTAQSRREAEDRLEVARREAAQLTAWARDRVKELDADTDRIWAERDRIVTDARELARSLMDLADEAAARFPAVEDARASAAAGIAGKETGDERPDPDETAATAVIVQGTGELADPDGTQPFDVLGASEEEDEAAAFSAQDTDGDEETEGVTAVLEPDDTATTTILDPVTEPEPSLAGDDDTADFEAVRVRPFDPTRTQAFRPIHPPAGHDDSEERTERFRPFDAEQGAAGSGGSPGGESGDRYLGELRFSEERGEDERR